MKIAIIGAGGVSSYLLLPLIKAFKPTELVIVDADILEDRNLDRQLFETDEVGKPKAVAMAERAARSGAPNVRALVEYLDDFTDLGFEPDLILGCADNHMARKAVLEYVDCHPNCIGIVGGNEYFDHEAYIYVRDWRGTERDPRVRFPAIETDRSGSPIGSCTGESAGDAGPQLAVANFGCAAMILHLAHLYLNFAQELKDEENPFSLLPNQLQASLTNIEALNHKHEQ